MGENRHRICWNKYLAILFCRREIRQTKKEEKKRKKKRVGNGNGDQTPLVLKGSIFLDLSNRWHGFSPYTGRKERREEERERGGGRTGSERSQLCRIRKSQLLSFLATPCLLTAPAR